MYYQDLTILSDSELIASLKSLALTERKCQVSMLRHLREMDKRRLADKAGFPSLFEYCVRELRYTHAAAARLVHASRAATKYPLLYRTLGRGLLSLTTISMLAPHLTRGNYSRLVRSSMGRSAREVEALIASLTPLPAVPAERVRFIAVPINRAAEPPVPDLFSSSIEFESSPADPAALPAKPEASPADPAILSAKPEASPVDPAILSAKPEASPVDPAALPAEPDSPVSEPVTAHASEPVFSAIQPVTAPPTVIRRVHFSFTANEELLQDVERVKELSRHKWPAGKLEDVFAGAIKALLEKIDPDRAKPGNGRERSGCTKGSGTDAGGRNRKIPRSVRNAVWRRDGGRCAFKSGDGRICGTRSNLEFDHIQPWALGGSSQDPANIRLLCRAHNDFTARLIFGSAAIDAAIDMARSSVT